jgi:hypothetical protein
MTFGTPVEVFGNSDAVFSYDAQVERLNYLTRLNPARQEMMELRLPLCPTSMW